MKNRYYYITAALLVSLFLYVFYRTEKTLINDIVIRTISYPTYALLKAKVTTVLPLNNLVVYSLPEGLWVFCITITSKPYFIPLKNRHFHCVYIPLLFSTGLELLQLLHITKGRFDFMDIWVSFVFWFIANFAFTYTFTKQNIFSSMNPKAVACLASYSIVYLSHVLD